LEQQLEVIKSFIEDNNPNIADLEDSSEPGGIIKKFMA
jgi:hypothetical protein